MSEEFINYSYIEMLIQDLEENSLGYWGATQDEMAKSLRILQQENTELKEKLSVVNQMDTDNYNKYCETLKENTDLKKQLEYLRSGEYLNQLKFERNMLENIVQNMEVSKEDKEFIDMTHRNTELLEENQELKEKIKATNKGLNKVRLKRKKWKYQYYKERNKNKELKKWLEEEKPTEDMNENFIMIRLSDLKDKIRELEQGNNDK